MNTLLEHIISCPYCNESIIVLIDPSVEQQAYIEDCQVCCQPIEFRVLITEGELSEISVSQDNQ
ncbi:MAG: CPXCG motif-containing cysteine-rich protein [Gammaproteobacteria bacterium]|nr:CPXCG motif-containing cysteine-rich protein [Gammaproteobacteria bacterium]